MHLDNLSCSKLLQHLEQEGLYDQILPIQVTVKYIQQLNISRYIRVHGFVIEMLICMILLDKFAQHSVNTNGERSVAKKVVFPLRITFTKFHVTLFGNWEIYLEIVTKFRFSKLCFSGELSFTSHATSIGRFSHKIFQMIQSTQSFHSLLIYKKNKSQCGL